MYSVDASLFVNRGIEGGNMTTIACTLETTKKRVYQIAQEGLVLAKSSLYAIDLEEKASNPKNIKTPPFTEVAAIWDERPIEINSSNNIFGENGTLTLPSAILDIPVVQATDETLAYYGATLIEQGDTVRFPDENFPIFRMDVGPNYLRDFIMTKEGGGFYLEYHYDRPHFHMPLRGNGVYLLARWNDERTHLQITAFRIGDGQAVYTKKGAIHCDAPLVGDLLVGYASAKEFSTVLLRTEKGEMVDLNFIQ